MSSGGGHSSGGLPGLSYLTEKLDYFHIMHGLEVPAYPIVFLFIIGVTIFSIAVPSQTAANWNLILFFSPLWLPLILVNTLWLRWLEYVRSANVVNQGHTLLEIRIPREILKTPLAMDTFFSSLHIGSGETTWYKRLAQGRSRPWWSFEIVSIEGTVHFYIWTWAGMRRTVETFLYAQYPDIEIVEAADYSRMIDPTHSPYIMTAFEYQHTKPIDAYPIRTYVDYGLDKQGSAEPNELVDPLSQMLELMGSLGKGQQLWMQIIIRSTKNAKFKGMKNANGGNYTWKDQALEEIEKIRKSMVRTTKKVDPVTGAVSEVESFPNPTKGQQETIAAIERNVGKLAFDTGIRAMYFEDEKNQFPWAGALLVNLFKPFNSEQLNGFELITTELSAVFNDWPWEDLSGKKKYKAMHHALENYRRRVYFHPPYIGHYMTLSTEELATLYHIPSSTVSTPSLARIQSRTGEAPSNLPS